MSCINTKKSDLVTLVRCHQSTFPDALSTKLGTRFTSKMLSWYIESDRGIMFHLEQDGEIVGYVGGIVTKRPDLPGAATSSTQHSFKTFVLAFLIRPWLIFHPENRTRFSFIWRNIKMKLGMRNRSHKTSITDATKNFTPFMGLVVIGVSPKHQGKGYGSILLKEFETRARNNGITRINLSVKSSNQQAIGSYKKNGWLVASETHNELIMYKNLE